MSRTRFLNVVLWCLAGVALLVPLTAVLLWEIQRPASEARKRYDFGFSAISRGMSPEEVVRLMGKPHAIHSGQKLMLSRTWWDDVVDQPGCSVKVEYEYHVDTFFLPIDWLVGFDANQKVISKHRWD